jgi:integrase
MPRVVTPLSDMQIKNAKPQDKDYTLTDGGGLYLLVKQSGSKIWRYQYSFNGKRFLTSFGTYPAVSLLEAREKRAVYQKDISNGINPADTKKEIKAKNAEARQSKEQIFEALLRQWIDLKRTKVTKNTADKIQRTFELYFLPFIGQKPITEISKQEYIELILRMRDKGIHYYAHKTKGMLQQFLNYLEESNILENAPQLRLENALPKPQETNYPHITDLRELGKLLRAIDNYQGDISTKYALMLAPLVFVRPANIRFMEWSEIDFEKKIWRIPADKMKMRTPHIVPLSRQAIEILKEVKKVNGVYKYVFVSPVSTIKPLSENTLNMGLMRIGYKGVMVSHGFRHTASTILHEHISEHGFHTEVIERQLAHAERNGVKAAYNHAEYIKERTALMQWWADFLDKLKQD